MKVIRRMVYAESLQAVGFVTLGFVALFFFLDFVEELPDIGSGPRQQGYQVLQALLFVTLMVPSHLYDLLPITVLIGTIFVMARLAQTSEFTILRTSGLGPWRALRTLLSLGAAFAVLTFAVGDYLAPWADRTGQLLKSQYRGAITIGQTGAWIKERQGDHDFTVNVAALSPRGEGLGVRVFEFNPRGELLSQLRAERARFTDADGWMLENVQRLRFGVGTPNAPMVQETLQSLRWSTGISAEMVSVALLKPQRMGTLDLFAYIRHLDANGQSAQRYSIEFWRKVFYPLSCIVMVILALPFAYLHFRSGTIATFVFAGVLLGISFFLLNNVFGYVGTLRNWEPWITAASPSLIYTLVSLGAFGWLVLKR